MNSVGVYLFTYNCGLLPIIPEKLSSVFFHGLLEGSNIPDLIAVSLQEVAEASIALLGGVSLDRAIGAIQDAGRRELDEMYTPVAQHSMGMTAILVLAREPEKVRYVKVAEKGTSAWEMGIKGGIAAKIGIAIDDCPDSEVIGLTFVGAHLRPHEVFCKERNMEWESLVRGLVFEDDEGVEGIYHPHSHLFVLGDFNYRTSSQSPLPTDYLKFPQPSPSNTIPIPELLKRDQLTAEKNAGRVFHGLEEPDVSFPPTFKFSRFGRDEIYDPKRWDWAPHRWPSWCDRILYLPLRGTLSATQGKGITVHKYTSIPELMTSDHKPVSMHLSLPAHKLNAPAEDIRYNPPFPLDKDFKSRRASARRKEVAVGILAWASALRLGWILLFSVAAGAMSWWWLSVKWSGY